MIRLNKIILFAALVLLSACNADEESVTPDASLEINGITATIGSDMALTRADETSKTGVGRTAFVNGDQVVLTTIKRKNNTVDKFSYSNICYDYDGTSWERSGSNAQEKIYWTDVTNPHIFAGYCLPKTTLGYHWVNNNGIYSGELGHGSDAIDFSSGNDVIKDEDLLISYSDSTIAQTGGASTEVYFTHALSNVCVIVNIADYAAKDLDMQVDISEMKVLNQPCVFTWGGNGKEITPLNFGDASQKKKDITLWRKSVDGDGGSKTFKFYGLTTPQNETYRGINGNDNPIELKFTVKYPDAMNNGITLENKYKSSISGVEFKSGVCTILKISLNHKGEQMGMDVSYSDWNYVATPDIGELVKKSTYMNMSIDKVTIHSAENLTADDATWLYIDISDNNKVKDIYGNDGTAEKPYRITSAEQMLSFAKEVNNGNDFGGKTVRLDADITMQKSANATDYTWAGIGTGDKSVAFNGTFLGGDRYINHLKGSPLFISLGTGARVEQLYITTTGEVNDGALAGTNNGVIGACKVIDETTTTSGALVGTNNGTIYACFHTGAADGVKLVGTNGENAKTVGCYVASEYSAITSTQVDNLNNDLKALYEANTALTQYEYVYSPGSYPVLKKK